MRRLPIRPGWTASTTVSIEVPQPESPDDSIEYRTAKAIAPLGLKLEARKVSTDTIVVDSASKVPMEN